MLTPSQTIGPFFGFALPYPGGGELCPAEHPDAITVHGVVYDGAGAPIPDALLEFWVASTGFGRVATDADGHYALRTLPPSGVSYISVIVFARGLLAHLHTRIYLAETADPRLATLFAVPEGESIYRFDLRLQGDGTHEETVFLDFG